MSFCSLAIIWLGIYRLFVTYMIALKRLRTLNYFRIENKGIFPASSMHLIVGILFDRLNAISQSSSSQRYCPFFSLNLQTTMETVCCFRVFFLTTGCYILSQIDVLYVRNMKLNGHSIL